jgi:death-on-curing protein
MTVFLTLADLLEIHRQVLEATGGAVGLRDSGLLDSAVHRPRASFGGAALYPSLHEQAAALLHSLVSNHPFVDGNKRTGFTATDVFLRLNGRSLDASEDEKYDFVIQIASGQMAIPQIAQWIAEHLRDPTAPKA